MLPAFCSLLPSIIIEILITPKSTIHFLFYELVVTLVSNSILILTKLSQFSVLI